MKDIKYRAWNTHSNVMFTVFGFDENRVYPLPKTHESYERENCILMQYIGIKDSRDREIYEGDIVDCTREGDQQYIECVVIKDIRNLPRALFGSSLVSREIVGNIYENMDLIE